MVPRQPSMLVAAGLNVPIVRVIVIVVVVHPSWTIVVMHRRVVTTTVSPISHGVAATITVICPAPPPSGMIPVHPFSCKGTANNTKNEGENQQRNCNGFLHVYSLSLCRFHYSISKDLDAPEKRLFDDPHRKTKMCPAPLILFHLQSPRFPQFILHICDRNLQARRPTVDSVITSRALITRPAIHGNQKNSLDFFGSLVYNINDH